MAMQEYESQIMALIAKVFGDQKVSRDDLKELLRGIVEECEMRLDSLE